jgi:transcription-repair coupling factor (superfamily II helicase)
MEGIRDFSVIATAPQRRLSIKTFVRRETDSVIREAVLRELKRGGQVYYLHNEVDTIENRREALEKILPEARIGIAHGQMNERDLERVMRDFYQQRFNVLLCTTIIETGIDVPTANTIVIHRADKFGLAQLHQLRGRVGRSHHQAYAYMMVNNEEGLSKNAERRLEAITMMEDLGSGFYLAMHDLEIRGAGEVLGANQSGNVHEVGFQMYTDMLNHAVRSLRAGKEPDLTAPLNATVEINLHTPALLPEDYCPDVHERLTLYKRLASTEEMDFVSEVQEELIDRFGKLPDAATALLETHRLRILAKPLGIAKIDSSTDATVVQFDAQPNVDAGKIILMIQKEKDMKLAGAERLRITRSFPKVSDRVQFLKGLIKQLA